VEGKAKTSRCGTMTLERLALLSVFACASAFAPAAPGALRPRNCEPLRTVTAANRGTLPESLRKACAVRASVAATVPGCANWREGVYWEWRGMKVRYAVMNPQGQKAPLLLVHGGFLRPSSWGNPLRSVWGNPLRSVCNPADGGVFPPAGLPHR